MLLISENFKDFLRLLGLRSSIHCFHIRPYTLNPIFGMDVKGNSAAVASAHMTNIDTVFNMLIHLAQHSRAVKCLLPDYPIFLQLCSYLIISKPR